MQQCKLPQEQATERFHPHSLFLLGLHQPSEGFEADLWAKLCQNGSYLGDLKFILYYTVRPYVTHKHSVVLTITRHNFEEFETVTKLFRSDRLTTASLMIASSSQIRHKLLSMLVCHSARLEINLKLPMKYFSLRNFCRVTQKGYDWLVSNLWVSYDPLPNDNSGWGWVGWGIW